MNKNPFIRAAALALCGGTLATNALAATAIDSCRTITAPGSYVVTKSLSASSADCLVVAASHVSIDLGGHRLQGSDVGTAVGADGPRTGISVRNGSISGFQFGVAIGRMSVVEQLMIENASTAIAIKDGRVRGNTIIGAAFAGIQTSGHAIVSGNSVRQSGQAILLNGNGQRLTADNVVLDSKTGINTTFGDLVTGNTVRSTLTPIVANCPALFVGNVTNAVKKQTNPTFCKFDDNIGQTP